MRVQYPAMASSTALSTTSQTRWCRPRRSGRPDVHARAVPDRFEAFENGDVAGVVGRDVPFRRSHPPPRSAPHARPFRCRSTGGYRPDTVPRRDFVVWFRCLKCTRRVPRDPPRTVPCGAAGERTRRPGNRQRRTRTSRRSGACVGPHASATRRRMSGASSRICVAHAGWSTATTSVVPSMRSGRTCAATDAPTRSSQRPNTVPTTSARPTPRRLGHRPQRVGEPHRGAPARPRVSPRVPGRRRPSLTAPPSPPTTCRPRPPRHASG